jgi:hypothetical protein
MTKLQILLVLSVSCVLSATSASASLFPVSQVVPTVENTAAVSEPLPSARLGRSLSAENESRVLQYSFYTDCGALAEPIESNWFQGVCLGDEPSDCCKLSGGGIAVIVVVVLAIVLGITVCSCACCRCCPWYPYMCCAPPDVRASARASGRGNATSTTTAAAAAPVTAVDADAPVAAPVMDATLDFAPKQ